MGMRLRFIIMTLLLVSFSTVMQAQSNELTLGIRAGHSASSGGSAAISLEGNQHIGKKVLLNGGIQYNTIGKSSIEVRPSYIFDLSWGRLSGDILLNYTDFGAINSIAAGAGIGLKGKWIGGKAGYYYRYFRGIGGAIVEPFNIYYEFHVNILPMVEKWDLQFMITNNEIFELERHYQPSFIVACSHNIGNRFGIMLNVGCRPAGMFNMSADYYNSFIKTGVCYRW